MCQSKLFLFEGGKNSVTLKKINSFATFKKKTSFWASKQVNWKLSHIQRNFKILGKKKECKNAKVILEKKIYENVSKSFCQHENCWNYIEIKK